MAITEILSASAFQLNIEALVSSVMTVERRPLAGLQSDQMALSRRSATLSDLKSSLSALRTKAQALAQAGTLSPFQVKAVSSSNTSVATATASTSALAAVHALSVSQLAKSSTVVSTQLTSTGTDVAAAEGAGTKSVKVTYDGTDPATSGTAVTVNVTLNAGDTNSTILTNLATAINNDATLAAKVSASVVNDTSSTSRLVLTSKQTGLANKVRVADTTGTLLNAIQLNSEVASSGTAGGYLFADATLDAKFKLDGLDMTRSSNSVSDVLTGVTINLLGLSASDVTLAVSPDKSAMKASVQEFLDAYNKALTFLRGRIAVTVSATTSGTNTTVNSVTRGPLAGEPTYAALVSTLRSEVGSSVSGVQSGNPALLAEVGITAAANGTLSISDTTKFDSAIATKLSGLIDLFASGSGVSTRLITRLDGFVNSGALIDGSLSTVTSKTSNINQQITRLQERLDRREVALRKQLLDLQKAMSALSAQRFILQ
jgi:flagellar hook-associated protein 2